MNATGAILVISWLIIIVLPTIYLIRKVWRGKKETIWKILLTIAIFAVSFCLFWIPIIWHISKAEGIFK
jgi:hypothetical protein